MNIYIDFKKILKWAVNILLTLYVFGFIAEVISSPEATFREVHTTVISLIALVYLSISGLTIVLFNITEHYGITEEILDVMKDAVEANKENMKILKNLFQKAKRKE